ncbi:MAG: hypothetical protein UV73_C0005G0118, partial [Candidatus Gottesmanbacteria bacterium GW2011_GWA2_43_14]
ESFRGNYRHLVTPFKADRLFYLESVTYVSQPTHSDSTLAQII